eukprot:943433-Pyramimonas_sp.AAC.1
MLLTCAWQLTTSRSAVGPTNSARYSTSSSPTSATFTQPSTRPGGGARQLKAWPSPSQEIRRAPG